MKKHYIKNKFNGISLGLEFEYRLTQFRKKWVLYRMSDGLITEKIKYEKNDSIYESQAIQRLYQINGIDKIVDEATKQEMELS